MEHDHLLLTHNCYQLTCNQNQLLSASLAIQTFANKLIYYQLSCNHIHLLSSLIYYPASLAIRPICYQSSDAINNFAIKFRTSSQSLFLPFFLLKIDKKMEKFGNLHSLESFAWTWNQVSLLPQV